MEFVVGYATGLPVVLAELVWGYLEEPPVVFAVTQHGETPDGRGHSQTMIHSLHLRLTEAITALTKLKVFPAEREYSQILELEMDRPMGMVIEGHNFQSCAAVGWIYSRVPMESGGQELWRFRLRAPCPFHEIPVFRNIPGPDFHEADQELILAYTYPGTFAHGVAIIPDREYRRILE